MYSPQGSFLTARFSEQSRLLFNPLRAARFSRAWRPAPCCSRSGTGQGDVDASPSSAPSPLRNHGQAAFSSYCLCFFFFPCPIHCTTAAGPNRFRLEAPQTDSRQCQLFACTCFLTTIESARSAARLTALTARGTFRRVSRHRSLPRLPVEDRCVMSSD